MNELRWILAGLGLPTIGAIWWWSARRAAQAPGNAALRESTAHVAKGGDERPPYLGSRERAPSPLDPLSIRTDDPEPELDLDQPMSPYANPPPPGAWMAHPAPVAPSPAFAPESSAFAPEPPVPVLESPAAGPGSGAIEPDSPVFEPESPTFEPESPTFARESPAFVPERPATAPRPRASAPRPSSRAPQPAAAAAQLAGAAAPASNPSELQRIVSVRVCAAGESRWPGARLMAAFDAHGLAFGRYQVFHRRHSDGRSVFCVASLTEPGAFDLGRMATEEFRGVTLFAVLPGPLEPVQTLDEVLSTARELARELTGTVQDERGAPFSPQRAAALREDVARFQAHQAAASSR